MLRLTLTLFAVLYTSSHAALPPLAAQGKAVVEAAQCNRCHNVTDTRTQTDATGHDAGLPHFKRAMHCVDCHNWILDTRHDEAAKARMRETFPDWDRYLDNVEHFVALPDLGTLTRRVRPDSIRRYLDAPHDLRPYLEESMIPVRLTAPQKDAVVAYLTALAGDALPDASPDPLPSAERTAAGRKMFIAKHCADCHQVGNEVLLPGSTPATWAAMGTVARLAPNLRHIPGRIPRATLVRYIQKPKSVDPYSTMPPIPVTAREATIIADFLLTPIKLPPAKAQPQRFPLLSRAVGWDEVYDEVLGRICIHCHMDPASNDGDGGAGNTGGLSYPGLALELETYAGVQRGLLRDGKRVNILSGPEPLLYTALLKRHHEAARDTRGPLDAADTQATPGANAARPGMPLGLPPLPAAQMSLVRTWLSQGAPGPLSDD